ncbi:DUF3685 domain-containing protein [Myxosarcina sp. GI1]|uniref:DUF3685 domain-containing protein n=1 Tax=Myxosarcina sp. GI1 TaxID=1541065 RepID=UPI0005617558|nr:DUF3685 domain-containing protein [Myxosarcina sp. GI1]
MTQDQIKLFIVDNDPIFRLGFCTAIARYPDLVIIGQGDTSIDTFRQLTQGIILNVLVVGIGLDLPELEFSSLQFCQRIAQLYPQLPIFLLTLDLKFKQANKIKSWGVRGYCNKGTSIETVKDALRAIAYGENYWQTPTQSRSNQLQKILSNLSRSGRQEIADSLAEIERQLASPNLSDWERVFLVGRQRELLAAQWLSRQLVAEDLPAAESNDSSLVRSSTPEIIPLSPPTNLEIAPVFEDSVTAEIFERVFNDIQFGLFNRTPVTLEIDILQREKKQFLLGLILNLVGETLEELKTRDNPLIPIELNLRSIWQQATSDFFFLHYEQTIEIEREQLTTILLQEFETIKKNTFDKIYSSLELFAYLLGETKLSIDNVSYSSDAPEAKIRAENLLQNLIIQLANCVMQVILNNFYDLEIFKYNLYTPTCRTAREIASFRNELSWRYRLETYWEEPKNVFESRHRLFVLNNDRIKLLFIYAPRREELEQLQGIPWMATIAIETRDAISPRLRAVLSFAGSGVIFILTQVIGKGIGLIGKGIIQGIGSTIKDVPNNKSRK